MSNVDDQAREFLLLEYERMGAEAIASEAMGDGRVTLYVTLWAAAVAGAQAIERSDEVRMPVVVGVAGLVLLGLVTLHRLYRRATHTDRLHDGLVRLRRILIGADGSLLKLLPWDDAGDGVKPRRDLWTQFGLLQTVVLLNTGTALLGAMLLVPAEHRWPPSVAAAVMLAGQVIALEVFMRRAYDERTNRSHQGRLARYQIDLSAGAVVACGDEIALVESRDGALELPKGHPDSGESLEDAVVREIGEEVGVAVERPGPAQLLEPTGELVAGVPKLVVFYALRVASTRPTVARDDEIVRVHWLLPDEALARLTKRQERAVIEAWRTR